MQLKVVAFFKIREYTKRNEVKNLGQKEKLFDRLLSHPKDFTFNDAEALLGYINYRRSNKGKTSGSRVQFVCDGRRAFSMHKPHPQKELKSYQVKQLIEFLEQEGYI